MKIRNYFENIYSIVKKFILASPKDKLWLVLNSYIPELALIYQRWFNLNGKFEFENRSTNKRKLLIIVAGYNCDLWEPVFKRIEKFVEEDVDVCIASPGIKNKQLQEIAKKNNWSHLSTKENKLALAQNIAIKLHPKAKLIYKLDEDIFITKNYFSNLERTLNQIKTENIFNPGFVAPIINVNGFSYVYFLKKINKHEEYLNKFGEFKSSCMGVKAHFDPKAAIYLWENTLPLDKTAQVFKGNDYLAITHRFSIGAILFERELWETSGYFKTSSKGMLGVEEVDICGFCHLESRPAFLALNCLVGHFSFRPQNSDMKKFFYKNQNRF